MHTPDYILALIDKYLNGSITEEEKKRLDEWYHSFPDEETEIETREELNEDLFRSRIKARLDRTIRQQEIPVRSLPPYRRVRVIAAAAAVLLLLSSAIYFLQNRVSPASQSSVAMLETDTLANDMAPGSEKAILTLADGSTILLDSARKGKLTSQGNIEVRKLDNGQLAYFIGGERVDENSPAFYNTISTPRGGQYQVTLSDGTKVWLNAASSLRFPVLFTGREREVEITGEAYFEVTPDKTMPFIVNAESARVEVLGTHFNVNAYTDEASIKTTLLEGKVNVSGKGGTAADPVKLQPGQQARLTKEGRMSVIPDADTEEAVAWKNGRFQFRSADIKTIMRQIARWYDAEVIFQGEIDLHFTGQLTRNENASRVFEQLELTNEVHFRVEGKKVYVMP